MKCKEIESLLEVNKRYKNDSSNYSTERSKGNAPVKSSMIW